MVVQTRFFSCRFSISHAKQRPTTAPRRAARVRATAFPARLVRRLVRGDTKCECGGGIRPLPIDVVDRKRGFRRLPARFFYQRRPAKRPAKLPILLFIKLEKLPAVTVDHAA